MCGATSEQKQLQAAQIDFYKESVKEAETAFGESQAMLTSIKSIYDPILAKGINQKGFSDEERTNLDTQIKEGTASNFQKASRAANEQMATLGGGNNPMPTGGQEQLKEEVANAAATEESRQQSQVITADYAQGRENFVQATNAELAASAQLNPVNFNEAATGAGSAAEKTASDIAAADSSWVNAALGAVGSIGSAVVAENPHGIFG